MDYPIFYLKTHRHLISINFPFSKALLKIFILMKGSLQQLTVC